MGGIELKEIKKGQGLKIGDNKLYREFPKVIPESVSLDQKKRR